MLTRQEKLTKLRACLTDAEADILLIPHEDEFLSEYLPEAHERLAWLTGFTGSAGVVIITSYQATLLIDGRYSEQAAKEVPATLYNSVLLPSGGVVAWLKQTYPDARRIAVNPWLITAALATQLGQAGFTVVPLLDDPVDALWLDRPALPMAPLYALPLTVTGATTANKIAALLPALHKQQADAYSIAGLDALAWLLNLRGNDIGYNSVFLARGLLYRDGRLEIFVAPARVETINKLVDYDYLTVRPLSDFAVALRSLTGSLLYDPKLTPYALSVAAPAVRLIASDDQAQAVKACKNAVEISGFVSAHRRDGAALCRFLAWLETKPVVTEYDAALRLTQERQREDGYQQDSFPTIMAFGANAAVVHYRPPLVGSALLAQQPLLLIDSGAHYRDGTTDVTRTVVAGNITAAMRTAYTAVLRGHSALARCTFPQGTTGAQLDALARQYLWQCGLDFNHGTGHGVGHNLSVHEGPVRISKTSNIPLAVGQVFSNEPGYYASGEFGIRLENLMLVEPAPQAGWLTLRPLTLAPFDTRALDLAALSPDDKAWLNTYHALVLRELTPHLQGDVLAWLQRATAPLL